MGGNLQNKDSTEYSHSSKGPLKIQSGCRYLCCSFTDDDAGERGGGSEKERRTADSRMETEMWGQLPDSCRILAIRRNSLAARFQTQDLLMKLKLKTMVKKTTMIVIVVVREEKE